MKYRLIIAGLAALLVLPLSTLPAAEGDPQEEELYKTAREIYDSVMCPICAGQTIAQSSNETSVQMRDLVLKKLRQGESKEDILKYFESRYGERILAMPRKKDFNLLLWSFPFLFVALGGILLSVLIRRWSTKGQPGPFARLNEDQLAGYRERMEKELEQFNSRS